MQAVAIGFGAAGWLLLPHPSSLRGITDQGIARRVIIGRTRDLIERMGGLRSSVLAGHLLACFSSRRSRSLPSRASVAILVFLPVAANVRSFFHLS